MKKSRGTIKISAPIAGVGDTVRVLNYRMRPAAWERGEVRSVKYSPAYRAKNGNGSTYPVAEYWRYEVRIKRREGGYAIQVCDDGIKGPE